jgi:SH3-like domain-containing protein
MAGPPGWKTAKTGPKGVNMRREPKIGAPVIRVLKTGDWVRPYGTPVASDNNRWQRVTDENCQTGWVSLNVIELVGGGQ